MDRLDGKITEEFWEAKSAEWQQEEQTLLASLRELEQAGNPERVLDRVRILELANKAHSLYVTQTPAGKSEIAENGAIELRRGRGKCLSHLQKALRHDLRTGENKGMVGLGRLEPPTSPLSVLRSLLV